MNKEVKVFKSAKCNELVLVLKDDDGNLACCGEPMKLLKANTTDAANEKHVPVATVNGNVVDVVVGCVHDKACMAAVVVVAASEGCRRAVKLRRT